MANIKTLEKLWDDVIWAISKLREHPEDGDSYWLTQEGKEVMAIAENHGLI